MYISSILGSREVPPARSRSRRMSAVLTKGRKFALVLPSTNTSVEREFHHLRPQDCSWHTGRIMIKAPALDSANAFQAFRECLNEALPSALEVTTGATAAGEALKAFGAQRIGVVTPYQPVGDEQVVAYFTELGYDVAAITGLCSASATSIADETPETLRAAFLSVDGPDVDALIQCGTNLECIAVAAELEKELGKPVIAINLATMWHAFRVNGIDDKIAGYGSLMEVH